MTINDKLFHKRLPEWEQFDHVEVSVVPRYKTSGLSGDEWRQSVVVQLFFKGVVIRQRAFMDMRTAMAFLPGMMIDFDAIPAEIIKREKDACDQPSCQQKAVGRFQLKRQTAPNGEWLDPAELYGDRYRQFCLTHVQRGDCSREDADDNYIPLDKVGASDTQNNEESPSIFGGIIDLSEFGKGKEPQ